MRRSRSSMPTHSPAMPGAIGHGLRRLASWAVAASLGAAAGSAGAGCEPGLSQGVPDGAGGGSSPPGDAWIAPICRGPDIDTFATPVNLARMPGSLELYYTNPGTNRPVHLPHQPRIFSLGRLGEPCGMASDSAACLQTLKLTAAPSMACVADPMLCAPFAIVTDAGEARRIDDRAELLALLGSIDTPAEAAIVAAWSGVMLGCPTRIGDFSLRGTEVRATSGGFTVRSEWAGCGPVRRDTIDIAEDGSAGPLGTEALGTVGCAIGRRPEGLITPPAHTARAPLAALFAEIARLEAASVFAFERLARELARLDAPAELIAQAGRAALDEIRHARITGALARRYGAEPGVPSLARLPERSRFAIALENAVEGCVRETYGALVAHHQARLARDPQVRAALHTIAADETRHAELAWQIAAWLEPQLTAAERELLLAARRLALLELAAEVEREPLGAADLLTIGWPTARVAGGLVARLADVVDSFAMS